MRGVNVEPKFQLEITALESGGKALTRTSLWRNPPARTRRDWALNFRCTLARQKFARRSRNYEGINQEGETAEEGESKGRREKVRQRRGPSRENSRGIVRDITTGYGAGGREGGWVGGWMGEREG